MLKQIAILVVGWSVFSNALPFSAAAEPAMRLRLKNGSFGAGTIVGVEHDDQIGWRSDTFELPFRFDARAIRSLTRVVDVPKANAQQPLQKPDQPPEATELSQFIELVGGGAVVGRLVGMDDQWLSIESPSLGTLQVAREYAVALTDASYAGQIIYSGPLDDDRWQPLSEASDWEFQAGALVARRPGASIIGNVNLPAQSQISLSLSWSGTPDFVLSLGTLAGNKVSKVEEVPSAARLEVWANQLALVREVDGGADIAMLAELNPVNPRIDLNLYLDQKTGTVVACDAHGRPLETLKVAGIDPKVRPSVHLANSGPSLNVERFEVREWDGVVATASAAGAQGVLDTAGERLEGQIVGFDAASGQLRIALADGQEQQLSISKLRRGNIAPQVASQSEAAPSEAKQTDDSTPAGDASQSQDAAQTELPPAVVQPPSLEPVLKPDGNESKRAVDAQAVDEVEADAVAIAEESPTPAVGQESSDELASAESKVDDFLAGLEIVLLDRTRLKGRSLASSDPNVLRFEASGVRDVLQIPIAAVRGLIGDNQRYSEELVDHSLGTLKCNEQQLYGYLEATSQASGSAALVWHPLGSFSASPLSPQATGSIGYRKPLPTPVLALGGETTIEQPRRILAPAVGMFLGRNGIAAAKADKADENTGVGSDGKGESSVDASAPEAREILFRTGDAVDGVVEQIDDSGMRFRSSQTETQFVPHSLIQHVWLNRKRGVLETSPEKLKRLMTVPRSMKNDPPTHLFIAINGDYLRGRLVSLQADKLTVEIRLERLELQVSQIAQIIWLHDRDWNEKQARAAQAENKAQEAETQDSLAQTTAAEAAAPATAQADDADMANMESAFLVHAIGRTERGLTFQPQALADGVLSGHSDLLGHCAIAIADVNQLLFGCDVTAQVRAYREDPWTLSLAQLPRVYMDDGSDTSAGGAGGASPLVGLPATDFTLKTLAGESFRLSKNRDRVVVLDFWASWCGPCVQTMPLVEEAVAELGSDQVQLVAVNIQETAARAQAAVDRLGMSSTVLLDSDGQAAAAYAANAIPQTVIIDRAGKVTHVFVGGGPKFVAQFKQALAAVVETSIDISLEAAGATPAE